MMSFKGSFGIGNLIAHMPNPSNRIPMAPKQDQTIGAQMLNPSNTIPMAPKLDQRIIAQMLNLSNTIPMMAS
jgi:hypothetical protein